MIEFTVPGEAVSFQTKTTRFKRGDRTITGTRKTAKAEAWQAEVRRYAAMAWESRPLLDGPVRVDLAVYSALPKSRWLKRNPRPEAKKTTKVDADKVLRLVFDALEGVVYANDAQVCDGTFSKRTAAQGKPARTVIRVGEA